jgi:AcrR family transcriptional regulator
MADFMVTRKPLRNNASELSDLRQRVLDTSRVLLENDGVAALSMREVARRAGVTHQAPYHHFPDRESILAELVTQGYEELSRRLSRANDNAPNGGKRAAMMASSEAYVGFAIENPGVFRIMFRPDVCDPMRFPLVLQAGARARAELEKLVRIVHDGAYSEALASLYWAHVHGLACLIVDGQLGQRLLTRGERLAHAREASRHFADLVLGPGGTADAVTPFRS